MQPPKRSERLEARHETRDASFAGVLAFVAALVMLGVVVTLVLWAMFLHFRSSYARADRETHSMRSRELLPPAALVKKFPEPRVQADPIADLEQFRRREDRILNSYSVGASGEVHIPIERAKELLLERPLPVSGTMTGAAKLPAPALRGDDARIAHQHPRAKALSNAVRR